MERGNLYVTEHGIVIGCSRERLVLSRGRETLLEVPCRRVGELVIMANASVTPQAIRLLLDSGAGVAYLSSGGTYRGRLESELSGNGNLRRKQTLTFSDPAISLQLAICGVTAKIGNALMLILRRKDAIPGEIVTALKALLAGARKSKSLHELRGIEGNAARLHFRALSLLLSYDLGFKGRTSRPPEDPINAMLSLGYTLLYNRMRSSISIVGLDPFQGYYHACEHGHASLASDLIEPFRAIIVDSLVISAVNSKAVLRKDFVNTSRGPRLSEEALEKFVGSFDRRMSTIVTYAGRNERVSYARCLEYQARDLAAFIMGKSKTFIPFALRG